jgi:hypothetical protein
MGHTVCTEPQRLYKGALYLFILYVIVEDVLAIPGNNLQCSLDMVCTYTRMVFKINYLANEYAHYHVQTLSNPSM